MTALPLGHQVVGSGPRRLIVLNDWLCDTSTWQSAHVYLDQTRFSLGVRRRTRLRPFARCRTGSYTLHEKVADVLALADALAWPRFCIVGHSMSTYAAMHLGQHAGERVERAVLITPGPPRGFGADDAWLSDAQANTRDDMKRAETVRARFAERLSARLGSEYKTQRWLPRRRMPLQLRATSLCSPAMVWPLPEAPLRVPVLAITGEEDAPSMRREAVVANLSPLCTQLEVVGLPLAWRPLPCRCKKCHLEPWP